MISSKTNTNARIIHLQKCIPRIWKTKFKLTNMLEHVSVKYNLNLIFLQKTLHIERVYISFLEALIIINFIKIRAFKVMETLIKKSYLWLGSKKYKWQTYLKTIEKSQKISGSSVSQKPKLCQHWQRARAISMGLFAM